MGRTRTGGAARLGWWTGAVVAFVATLWALVPGAMASAADTLRDTSASVFRLDPAGERVRVAIDLSFTNQTPDRVRIVACPGRPSVRCRQTTRYYYDRWGYLWVPGYARSLKVQGAKATLESEANGWRNYVLSFARIQRGQTRRIKVTFDLPAAGPRSSDPVRVTEAYSHFCWNGQPTDRGSAVAVLPTGYEQDTFGDPVRARRTGKGLELTARRRTDMGEFQACTDAFDLERLVRTRVNAPSGHEIIIEGWPEDPEWSETVARRARLVLPDLEEDVGRPIPGDEPIVIRQVAGQALLGYAGEFNMGRSLIRLDERLDAQLLIAHELSHAWFGTELSGERWVTEGLAEWAGRSAIGISCDLVQPRDGAGPLSRWRFLSARPTEEEQDQVNAQYEAACSIHQELADAIGHDAMRAVLGTLLDGADPYAVGATAAASPVPSRPPDGPPVKAGSAPTPSPAAGAAAQARVRTKPATWRDWLDAFEEVGLRGAGLAGSTLARDRLLEFGIAREKDLRGRDEVRAAYHALVDGLGGHQAPAIVRRLLREWRYEDALTAIDTAAGVAGGLATATAAMSPQDAAAAWQRFEGAGSLKALRGLASG